MSLRTKSPTREKSSRQNGRFLPRGWKDIVVDRLVPMYSLLFVLWVIAFVEWQWLLGGAQPKPGYTTILAVLITVYVVLRTLPEIRRLRELRADGARARAEEAYLDRLRGLGFRVLHDVPGHSANIDHVIVSTHGVFTIEVKSLRRPRRGRPGIFYDGRTVAVDGGPADTSPVVQARAQAAQVRALLKQCTDAKFPVRAVVLYPGWHVESRDTRGASDVWVLSPKSLPMWIKQEPETVHGRDVNDAASRLGELLRGYR